MLKKAIALMSLLLLSSAGFAKESGITCLCEDIGLEASAKTGMYSQYISRGVTSDNDPVVQNDFFVAYRGFNFDYWTSMPATVDRDALDSNEIDLNLSYGLDFEQYSFRVGHISYQYSITNGLPTREWFVSAASKSDPISWCFTYYNDYDQFKGNYFSIDLERAYSAAQNSIITITPFLHVGAYSNYSIFKNGGDLVLGSKGAFKLLEHLAFVPALYYSIPYGDVADEKIGNEKAAFVGGANFEFSF